MLMSASCNTSITSERKITDRFTVELKEQFARQSYPNINPFRHPFYA